MGYFKILGWFLGLALFSTQVGAVTPYSKTQKTCASQNVEISRFETLDANGTFTIIPTRAPFSSGVWISGPCEALKTIKIQNNGDQLTIASTSQKRLGPPLKENASATTIEVPIGNMSSLTVTLEGRAELIMGDLGLKKLNIQTKDQAHAQVTARDWLNMIALNHSSIYFTGRPKHVDAQSYDQSTLVSLLPPEYY